MNYFQIKDKFGRFTQKEVKRHKLQNLKPLKTKKRLDPLSIDAAHYNFNNPLANGNGEALSVPNNIDNNDLVSEAESVSSAEDLINFSDDENTTQMPLVFTGIESALSKEKSNVIKPLNLDSTNKMNELFFSDFLTGASIHQQQLKLNNPGVLTHAHSSASLTQRRINLETAASQKQQQLKFSEQSNFTHGHSSTSIQRRNNWETFE